MRASLALLAALLGACSDSSGPPRVPVLTTQLSATADSINGVLSVTLNASNPTDTTVRLAYLVPTVFAEIKFGGQWRAGFSNAGSVATDTLVLTPGASAPVGVVYVLFTPPASQSSAEPAVLITNESFAIAPGMYSIRACVIPPQAGVQGGTVVDGVCGNGLSFTLTP